MRRGTVHSGLEGSVSDSRTTRGRVPRPASEPASRHRVAAVAQRIDEPHTADVLRAPRPAIEHLEQPIPVHVAALRHGRDEQVLPRVDQVIERLAIRRRRRVDAVVAIGRLVLAVRGAIEAQAEVGERLPVVAHLDHDAEPLVEGLRRRHDAIARGGEIQIASRREVLDVCHDRLAGRAQPLDLGTQLLELGHVAGTAQVEQHAARQRILERPIELAMQARVERVSALSRDRRRTSRDSAQSVSRVIAEIRCQRATRYRTACSLVCWFRARYKGDSTNTFL
jgi:hypothetical protein